MTYLEAKRIAQDQDAYGKWNTAPAWNRAERLRRAEMSPLRRIIDDALTGAGYAVLFVVSYGLPVLGLVKWYLA